MLGGLDPVSGIGMVLNAFGQFQDAAQGEKILQDFMEQRGYAFDRQDDANTQLLDNAHWMDDTYSPMYQALNQSIQSGAGDITNQYGNQYSSLYDTTRGKLNKDLNNVNQGYTDLAGSVNGSLASALGGVGQGYNRNTSNVANAVSGLQGQVASGYGNLTDQTVGQYSNTGNRINNQYESRMNNAMGIIDRYGAQKEKDIRQDYTSSGNTDQARLARRGLGNSTITSSLGQANQEGLQNSLGRLGEQITQQKLDTYTGTSKDTLNNATANQEGIANLQSGFGLSGLSSMQDLGKFGVDTNNSTNQAALNFGANAANTQASYASNLGQAGLNAQQSGATSLADLSGTLGMNTTNAASDLAQWGLNTSTGAQQGYLSNAMGLDQMPYQQYQTNVDRMNNIALNWGQPPQTTSAFTGIGANMVGVGQANAANRAMVDAAAAQGSKASASLSLFGFGAGGGCVDCKAIVESENGPQTLSSVVPGDKVRSTDGEFYTVIAKDCGSIPVEAQECHIQISAGGSQIVTTCDHIVDGHRADDWSKGDTMIVNGETHIIDSVDLVPYRVSGDLMLEGNRPYVANGFVCHSMIGAIGVDNYAKVIEHGGSVSRDGLVFSVANPAGVWAVVEA